MALFRVWRWQIIPKLLYYNFWPPAKIRASKNRPVIMICLRSRCLEHKSRSCWQQPALGAWEHGRTSMWGWSLQGLFEPATICSSLTFWGLGALQETSLYEFVQSFFLLSLYKVKSTANKGHCFSFCLWSGFPIRLVGRWHFFGATQRWKGLFLLP